MRKMLVLALLLFITIIAKPVDCYACSCIPLEDFIEGSSIVAGTIVKQNDTMFVLEVEKYYKGNYGDEVIVYVDNFQSAACGYEYVVGESYYLVTSPNQGSDGIKESIRGSLCSTFRKGSVGMTILDYVDNEWSFPTVEANLSIRNPLKLPNGLPNSEVVKVWGTYMFPMIVLGIITFVFYKRKKIE